MIKLPENEAYLIGCLFGRGSIALESQNKYKIIIRAPIHNYSVVGSAVVKTLFDRKSGIKIEDLSNLSEIKSFEEGGNLGLLLARISRWKPSGYLRKSKITRKDIKKYVLIKVDGFWKIGDKKLAKEYLEWQNIYFSREAESIKLIIQHLKNSSSFLSGEGVYDTERSGFDILYHKIEFEISQMEFDNLKMKYEIDVGDVYRHIKIPKIIFNASKKYLEEFVRGIADLTGTFNTGPTVFKLLNKFKKERPQLWRIQFGFIHENHHLPINFCVILQEKLKIPVNVIGWAEEKGGAYSRGGRDHLVRVCLYNFRKFPNVLFYNKWKQKDFLEKLKEDEKVIKVYKREFNKLPNEELGQCPRFKKRIPSYIPLCKKYGCKRAAKIKTLTDFIKK